MAQAFFLNFMHLKIFIINFFGRIRLSSFLYPKEHFEEGLVFPFILFQNFKLDIFLF
jgi:hypothetical protein